MQTALKIQTIVTTEGKIEISIPELTPGKPVEIIILFPEPDPAASIRFAQHLKNCIIETQDPLAT